MDILKDSRANCYSVLHKMTVEKYISIARDAYEEKGGLEGQRTALKTKTAIRIRDRMVSDIKLGAVLPPIVLGVVASEENFEMFEELESEEERMNIIKMSEGPYVIDGMQRTTAFLEVIDDIKDNMIRVEYWIAKDMSSLIYRMLVLNTGQVPWSLKQQVEVVFDSIIKQLEETVEGIQIYTQRNSGRRSDYGQYQSSSVIELYLAFVTRKEKVDMKEELANEFSKSDAIEAMSDLKINEYFIKAMGYLLKMDEFFVKVKKSGIDLFSKQPATVALITALAQQTVGRPGQERSLVEKSRRWDELDSSAKRFFDKLDSLSEEQLKTFLDLDTLKEAIPKDSAQYGRKEREFFLKAFSTLFDEKFEVDGMAVCWRAY